MSDSHVQCPKCGSNKAHCRGGLSGHAAHHASHMAHNSYHHGSPGMALLTLGAAAVKALSPKKFTCHACGHEFR
jgi:hypothetical protein